MIYYSRHSCLCFVWFLLPCFVVATEWWLTNISPGELYTYSKHHYCCQPFCRITPYLYSTMCVCVVNWSSYKYAFIISLHCIITELKSSQEYNGHKKIRIHFLTNRQEFLKQPVVYMWLWIIIFKTFFHNQSKLMYTVNWTNCFVISINAAHHFFVVTQSRNGCNWIGFESLITLHAFSCLKDIFILDFQRKQFSLSCFTLLSFAHCQLSYHKTN